MNKIDEIDIVDILYSVIWQFIRRRDTEVAQKLRLLQLFYLDAIFLMKSQKSYKECSPRQSEYLKELPPSVGPLEQVMTKRQRLAVILAEKQQIATSITISIAKLAEETNYRAKELEELESRAEELERVEAEVSKLAERERALESQYEDYYHLQIKLDKEVKLMQEEAHILKGKTIIDFNKITEIREETASQIKQKEILERHLEELKRGVENLKKKIAHLKEEHKKKAFTKHKIEEIDIEREINKLRMEVEYRKTELTGLQKNRDQFITEDRYKEIQKEIERLKKENMRLEDSIKLNHKFMKERTELEERIKFLESVDIEFINEKRLLLTQLKQKHALFEKQMESSLHNLKVKQQELAKIVESNPEGFTLRRKASKRKREPRVKYQKKAKDIVDEPIEIKPEQKISRFKGHKFKKMLVSLSFLLIVFGLILSGMIGYSI